MESRVDINFWNNIWCSSKCISLIVGFPFNERIKLFANVARAWIDSSWLVPYPLFVLAKIQNLKIWLLLLGGTSLIGC